MLKTKKLSKHARKYELFKYTLQIHGCKYVFFNWLKELSSEKGEKRVGWLGIVVYLIQPPGPSFLLTVDKALTKKNFLIKF